MASNNDFMVKLAAALDAGKSKKQINSDIKQLEKTLNMMRLTATLLKGDSKKAIKAQINQIQAQLAPVKLAAKLDEKQTQRAVNNALKNVKFKDIDININQNSLNLKFRKALSSVNSRIPKITVPVDYDIKKQRLQNELTTYLTKNSKIRESSGLLNEADNLKALFDKINDKKSLTEATERFRLYKSEVQAVGFAGISTTDKLKGMLGKITQISSAFGLGALVVRNYAKALGTLKENSTLLVEIQKTSEATAKQIKEIANGSFSIASKYGVLSRDFLTAYREMSRAGFEKENGQAMAELSVLAKSAGDMTAELSNDYLIASNAAYGYQGNVKKLNGLLDSQNQVTNRNAVSMQELAEATKVAANQLSNANIKENEMTALLGTGIATTRESGSVVGRAVKAIIMNLQQVKNTDEGFETTEEDLSKVEKALDKVGISLKYMEDGILRLRNPMEVLDELSQKFNALPKDAAERADIISSVGGKYRSNVLSSILSNWNTTYQKMLGDYENAQGSAMREANKTADSWEGRLNQLSNTWTSLISHITDQSTIKGGISFLDTAIGGAEKLVDTLGAIPTLLTTITGAYTLLNKDYGITQVVNPQSGKLDVQGNYMGVNITALKAQKKHFSEAEDAIVKWNAKVSEGITDINKFEVSVVKNNTQLKEYLATCTDGSASLAGYRASLKAAGVETEGLRLKTVLTTSAMSFGLGLAIQAGMSLLTKVIDEQVHAQERALEAAQEASSHIKSINDTYASHRKVVEDTASAYDELSKGVDIATNKNISLGTEDYNKFLDINKQLAEAFPELISTIDENGNAILNLGTNGRSASDDLRELLAAEEDLQNFKISQELSDVFGGVKVQVDNALKNQEEYNAELEKTQESLKDIRDMASGKISIGDSINFTGDFMNEGDANKHNAYIAAIQKFYKQLTPERRIDIGEMLDTSKIVQMNPDGTSFKFYLNAMSLSNDEKQTLTNLIQEQSQDIAISLSDSIGTSMQEQAEKTKEAELAWKDFVPSLLATMKSKATFKELDETTQQIALHMVEGLQMDVADQMNKQNPYEYIRNSVIAPLSALSDEDLSKVSTAYEKLFSLDTDKLSLDDTKKQVDGYISTIADILGKDPVELKIQFGFDIDDLIQNYSTVMQKAAEKFSGLKGRGEKYEDEYSELNKFAKANSINTQNEIAFWNKCIEESKTREEAMKKYLDNSSAVNQGTNLTFLDTFDKLEEMSGSLKALDEAYANFIDKDKEVTFENLSALSENFKDVSGIESYIKAIQDAKGNTEATQKAFSNLSGAYIEHTGILEQVNQSNASLIQSYLQEQGVANADILVQQALTHNLELLEAQKYYTANASSDLVDAEIRDIAAFINSADAADVSKAALIELMMSKISCNETGVVTDGDIQNLMDLATAADIAKGAILEAKAAQGQKNASGVARSAGAENAINNSIYGTLESEVKAELYKPREYNFTGGAAANKARAGAGGSKGSKDKTKEPTIFEFMQNKVDKLDNTIEQLQDQVDTFISSVDKNNTTDTIVDQMIEKMAILQQMHDRYMEEAANVGLAQEYIDKIQNGTMNQDAIERISDENLVKQIQEYERFYKSATDTNDKIVETRKSIEKLNLSKLDNIKNQFDNILGAQNDLIDAQKQYLDLRESMGEEIYADDYADLIALQGELVNKNAEAYNRLANEMSKINLEKGSDEWYQYNEELQKYKNNMMSAASAVKEYMNAIVELEFKGLNDFKSQMDSISNTISTMSDLIGNVGLTDEKGKLTDLGLAKMALYAQQLANSKQEAAEYAKAMEALKDMLDEGLLTQDEYNKRLQDYTSAQNSAVQSTKEAKDAILSLVKDGILAEIDAKRKLVEETKAALDAERDLHDYQKSITEKQDNISKLERQIAALSNSTNREDIAQRLQLQSQLAEAKKELYELQYDHEIDQRKESLDKEFNDFEESKQKESDELDSNLDVQNAAIEKYLNEVKTKYSTVYGVLTQYGDEYSLAAIEDLTTPWNEGSNAADICSIAVGDALANIQYNIDSMDFSRLYEMVDLFNSLGMANGIGSSGGGDFEDISDQGRWQKGQGGKDWFGEDYDPNGGYFYASDGIYTINGKQYGFDSDGYMITGWNEDFGDWRYFEPANGEMVKSQWRKSRDNHWYYLDKDGVMATDMAVKAREGDGYYYLDDEGKWDGETLTAEQVRKLGYVTGYRNGTKRVSHDQLAWTQEDKLEIITRPSDGALLTPLKIGDGVIKGNLTQNLLDIAGNPNRFVEDIMARSIPNYKMPEFIVQPANKEQKIEVNMNIGGVLDEAAARVLSNKMPEMLKQNHMQITKQVWKDTGYGMKGK